MKKLFAAFISILLLLIFIVAALGEEKLNLFLPENVNIPIKTIITTNYEKVLPEYSKYLKYEGCAGGEACYVMGLNALGIKVTQEEINKAASLNVATGCNSTSLSFSALNLGIITESYGIYEIQSIEDRNYYLQAIKYFISKGYPIVISWTESPGDLSDDFCSFVLVVGYDDSKNEITVLDPYRGPETGRIFSSKDFLDRWQWDNSNGTYSFIMQVIKGKGQPKTKELAFDISKGDKVTLLYEFENTDKNFFWVEYDHKSMTVSIETRDDYNKHLDDWIINDAPSNGFYFYGGGKNYIVIKGVKGNGNVTVKYETGTLSKIEKY